jgi:hypothetical protein
LCTLHSAKEVELPDIAQIRSEAGQLLGPRFGDRIGERLLMPIFDHLSPGFR